MATISHLVKHIISKKPFLEEALARGLINYANLADELKPEIEQELNKEVKTSAVMMALRRYSEEAKQKIFKRVKFDKATDITSRSDLIEITIIKTPESSDLIKKLYKFVDLKKGDFISVVQGIHEISIITNKKHEENFTKTLKQIKNITKDLSSLTIKIPEDSTETIGLFYFITRSLSWENISIIEIVSTWSEMTYLVKTADAPKTLKILNQLVKAYSG